MSDARLFVAVEIAPQVRDVLAAWGGRCVQADPALRAVGSEALHITLHFLGARPEAEIPALGDVVARQAGRVRRPLELSLGGALWLAPRRPHVLTCAVNDAGGDLADLHRRLAGPLAVAAPGWTSERRDLTAHVTVARVRRGTRPHPGTEPAAPRQDFTAASLTLFRSWLGGSGASYEALERVALPPRPSVRH